jgi:peptidoglycan/xylan/chitin deacetylase (PgdA/CDA1 family)
MSLFVKAYYQIRPLIPRRVQLGLRRQLIRRQRVSHRDVWPVDPRAASIRPPWNSWPENKQFALVLTHDVEKAPGVEKVRPLMELEKELGFRSSFNFVPERYTLPPAVRQELTAQGFEVGVHGLLHDGKLYSSKKIFMERAVRINEYLKSWEAVGFRSPAMQHNLEWLHELKVLYDASTFDTDPFEPDNSGVCTIFPFWVPGAGKNTGYVELPYTLPQDSTLYLLMQEKNIAVWKQKLDWVAGQGGMVLVNTHPDYMRFPHQKTDFQTYPAEFYREFLEYLLSEYRGQYWHVLPREMAKFVSGECRTFSDGLNHEK